MQFVRLGRTGLEISRVGFGCGPVSGLMTGDDNDRQREVIGAALRCGVNWFDTAAGYGNGVSETNLGRVLYELSDLVTKPIHVATKVRLQSDSSESTESQVCRSVEMSLQRLQQTRVTLLQLHNGITQSTGDEPCSLSVSQILGTGGVLDAFQRIREQQLADFVGLTGTGAPDAMKTVLKSGQFDTIQAPYNLLNPSAGATVTDVFGETDYGNIFEVCERLDLGVFAIRVFAAGAVLGSDAGEHTRRTPFFPLSLYERDLRKAEQLAPLSLPESRVAAAINFVLAHPAVHSALIGFGAAGHVESACRSLMDGSSEVDGRQSARDA